MLGWLRRHGLFVTLGALALLLVLLAVLQYRWTGEIGRAESERRRTQLERSASSFASALGRELTQILVGLRMDPELSTSERRRLLLEQLATQQPQGHPGVVAAAWFASRSAGGTLELEACPAGADSCRPTPWPARLESMRRLYSDVAGGGESIVAGWGIARGGDRGPRDAFSLRPISFRDPPPTLVVPLLEVAEQGGEAARAGPHWMHLRVAGLVIVELDEGYLRERLLPQLAESHFGPLRESELVVAVVRRADDSVLYSSAPDLVGGDVRRADIQLPLSLFGFRGRPGAFTPSLDRETRAGGAGLHSREPGAGIEEVPEGEALSGAIGFPRPPPRGDSRTARVLRDGSQELGRAPRDAPRGPGGFDPGPGGASWFRRTAEEGSPWLLTVRHRGGSIEQAVAAARRRTLAVGLGVLALLGAAAVVLVTGAQRARHLARQQLEFVASVTHELNTPLAGIRSAGQNLSAGIITEPAQVQRYGEMIDQEGRRLAAIVAQVLDFSGIESGRRGYAADALTIAPLVDEVVADLGLALEQSGVVLERDLPPDLPAVRGDATALRRVIANLLTNAVKFASPGKRIWLRASQRAAGAGVVLRVEDAGPGIPPAERERVFEPFYRGSAAQRNDAPGSGLGLSLVRRIVQAHGGRVWIEEAAGGGACVVVELPSAPADTGVSS